MDPIIVLPTKKNEDSQKGTIIYSEMEQEWIMSGFFSPLRVTLKWKHIWMN